MADAISLLSSPAFFSFEQLPVGGNFNIQSQFYIEQILVLLQVSGHLLLQHLDLILQMGHSVLVTGRLYGETLLYLSQLTLQGLVLKDRVRRLKWFWEDDDFAVKYFALQTWLNLSLLFWISLVKTYRSTKRFQVTGQALDLSTILVGLLLSLSQSLCVTVGCISQINKLMK